jgi:hypothetical protein
VGRFRRDKREGFFFHNSVIQAISSFLRRSNVDHPHSYSFPGLVFLLAQLTYRFVPYGDYLLSAVLAAVVLSGILEWTSRAVGNARN